MTEPTEKLITKVEAWFTSHLKQLVTSKELAEILQQDWDCVFSVFITMAYLDQLSVTSTPGGYWSYRLKLPLKGDSDPSVIKSRGDHLRRTDPTRLMWNALTRSILRRVWVVSREQVKVFPVSTNSPTSE